MCSSSETIGCGDSAEGESTSSLTSAVAVSASTLAEDIRQLAQWCKGADTMREQQEGRLEQLNALPSLHAQIKGLSDKVSLAAYQLCMNPSLA